MPTHTLIFNAHSSSRYSVAALVGAVETDPRLEHIHIEAPVRIAPNLVRKALKLGGVTVAYSVMSTQTSRIYEEVKQLRSSFRESLTLVAGGAHASARPLDSIKNGFDFVVVGEGEGVLPELLHRISNGEDPLGIKGVVGRATDKMPRPRDLVSVNLDDYPPFALKKNILGPIEVTRGCPFSCRFCATPFLTGGRVRHRSVDKVVAWLTRAVNTSGFERTWFLSPNALSYGGRGRSVESDKLELLLRQTTSIDGLREVFFGSFPSEVRPEFVTKDVLEMMRQYVANDTLQIGLQSSSDRVLKLANRHHSVEDGLKAIHDALDCGFIPHVDMIFGLPGETPEERHASIELCQELHNMGAKIHGHVFMPLPGSAFENERAGCLDPVSRSMLGELSRKGVMTGAWSAQERLAKELASMTNHGGDA